MDNKECFMRAIGKGDFKFTISLRTHFFIDKEKSKAVEYGRFNKGEEISVF